VNSNIKWELIDRDHGLLVLAVDNLPQQVLVDFETSRVKISDKHKFKLFIHDNHVYMHSTVIDCMVPFAIAITGTASTKDSCVKDIQKLVDTEYKLYVEREAERILIEE